jgi:hypothetical protein
MVFSWLKSEKRKKRKQVRLDRKYLDARARRFLISYLAAKETAKPQFYWAVEDISKKCQPSSGLPSPEWDDVKIANATSDAAMKLVLANEKRGKGETDHIANFDVDACATVAVAYRRAAGVYTMDKEMQELGTAAVHFLTMATSYVMAHKE